MGNALASLVALEDCIDMAIKPLDALIKCPELVHELSEHRSQDRRQWVVQILRDRRNLSAHSSQGFGEHDAALGQDASDLTDQPRTFADQP